MAKAVGQKNVSAYDFAMAYGNSKSIKEVQEKLGMAYGSVLQRAKKMRKDGIKLPQMQRANGTVGNQSEIDKINEALAALESGEATEETESAPADETESASA